MKRYLLFLVLSFFTFVLPASADEGNYLAESPLMSNLGLFYGNTFEIKVEGNTVTVNVIDSDMIGETLRVYNLLEKEIFSKKISTEEQIVKVTLKKGIYLVNLGQKTRKVKIDQSKVF
jgi:hypothetical protein